MNEYFLKAVVETTVGKFECTSVEQAKNADIAWDMFENKIKEKTPNLRNIFITDIRKL